jgi:hypothetical protein
MSTNKRHQLENQLLAAHVCLTPDLYGYATVAAVAVLVDHWADCTPPLDVATKRNDVQLVIDTLREWQDTL